MSTALIQKLRYMARQYTSGQFARGGNPPSKHYLDEAADLLEQYHREASAARCPDCGERNPASIHTCSPQQPEHGDRQVSAEQWRSLAESATLAIQIDERIKDRAKRLGLTCPTCGQQPATSAESSGHSDGIGYFVVPHDLHEATAQLVARFASALAGKLGAAQRKYGFSDGWLQPDWMDECRAKLIEHVAKGDPRDVAAYCAFLWHNGEKTAMPAPSAEPTQEQCAELAAEHIERAAFDEEPTYCDEELHAYTLAALRKWAAPQPNRVAELEAECKRLQHEAMMANNRAHLLEEDIWCLHKCLDDAGVRRDDGSGNTYSMWGRVLQFRKKDAGLFDLLRGAYLDFLTENNLHLKYLPIYADQPDPTYVKGWVWEVRDASGSSVAQAHEWLYSAIDAALAANESAVISGADRTTSGAIGQP